MHSYKYVTNGTQERLRLPSLRYILYLGKMSHYRYNIFNKYVLDNILKE